METKKSVIKSNKIITLDKKNLQLIEVESSENGNKKIKITIFNDYNSAKTEFNRLTQCYRGCPRGTVKVHKTPVATAFYGQLIIG